MTEQEWLECIDPQEMLEMLREFLAGTASNRKLRLFTVACCRRIWHLLIDERSQEAVEVGERYADGEASEEELERARSQAGAAISESRPAFAFDGTWINATVAAHYAAMTPPVSAWIASTVIEHARDSASAAVGAVIWHAVDEPAIPFPNVDAAWDAAMTGAGGVAGEAEEEAQSRLLRDIFGNPFQPAIVDPSWLRWRDSTILRIAQAIYEERRFIDLSILADALEEAGCDNADVLAHCRQGGEHVRGCWVVDLILAKS